MKGAALKDKYILYTYTHSYSLSCLFATAGPRIDSVLLLLLVRRTWRVFDRQLNHCWFVFVVLVLAVFFCSLCMHTRASASATRDSARAARASAS
mgnify:CR=1 FL=1